MDAAGNLYGTTYIGGAYDLGSVFKLEAAGSESVLYSFKGSSDGEYPYSGVVIDNAGNLYGTTAGFCNSITCGAGASGNGTVYKLDPSGTLTVLHHFANSNDGANPGGLLLDPAGNLYGTTYNGGSAGVGTVFKIAYRGPGTFSATGSMEEARGPGPGIVEATPVSVGSFTATLLKNGKVLIAGGVAKSPAGVDFETADAEIYDPATGTFTATGSMIVPRSNHTATLLTSGEVLIDGGRPEAGSNPDELYDPSTGRFRFTGTPATPRQGGSATLLNDGRVLLAGGIYNNEVIGFFAQDEVYDPATESFTPVSGGIAADRYDAAVTQLNAGEVLIAGGTQIGPVFASPTGALAAAILYEPSTNSFVNLPNMTADRDQATATLLPKGKVLIAGGASMAPGPAGFHWSAELFDPTTRTFSKTGSMHEPRAAHTATLLPNGSVLVAGGYNTVYGENFLAETNAIYYSEVYNPATGQFQRVGNMLKGRVGPQAVLLNLSTHQVLVVGGLGFKGVPLSSAELFSY
jgi:uncharacterized repeat protein (TIGR03803 family)